MKRPLLAAALALVPLAGGTSCFLAVAGAAAGGGFIVSQQVNADDVHVAQVALDVDRVWPSVKETLGFYQEPGSELAVQDYPRSVHAKVDGAKVVVHVEAIDIDRTTIRVSAEKYLGHDSATASEVMEGILARLQRP
jgi:hypothetical protein